MKKLFAFVAALALTASVYAAEFPTITIDSVKSAMSFSESRPARCQRHGVLAGGPYPWRD